MFYKAQLPTFLLLSMIFAMARAQSPLYVDPTAHKSMMSIDVSGDESHLARAESIVAERYAEEGAIKRFSSVILDMSAVQVADEQDNQATVKDGSSESSDLVISPFPGINYLVRQTSLETKSHGVTTWRGTINGQENSRVRLTCGSDGR